MRPTKKLRSKYGKLTVLSEATINGRRTAIVNCRCGNQKQVLVDALTSGRTRSCGALECKLGHARTRVEKQYTPRGSRTISIGKLRRIWSAIYRKSNPISVAAAARKFGVEQEQTLYSVIRSVHKCGGIEEYARKVIK